MTLESAALPAPLHSDETGTLRVGGGRLTLDTVLHRFDAGDSPEVIAHCFPPVEVADIDAVIGYYLRHRAAVDAYLAEREAEAVEVRRAIEAASPSEGLRERLLARRALLRLQDHRSEPSVNSNDEIAR